MDMVVNSFVYVLNKDVILLLDVFLLKVIILIVVYIWLNL